MSTAKSIQINAQFSRVRPRSCAHHSAWFPQVSVADTSAAARAICGGPQLARACPLRAKSSVAREQGLYHYVLTARLVNGAPLVRTGYWQLVR